MTNKKLIAILAAFTLFISLSFAQSGELSDEDFDLEVDETHLEVGEILEAELELSEDAEESELEYRFEFYEQEAYEQPVFEQRVEEAEERSLWVSIEDSEGESVYADSETISVEETEEEEDRRERESEDDDDEASTHPVDYDFRLELREEKELYVNEDEIAFGLRNIRDSGEAVVRLDGENRELGEGESIAFEDARIRLEETRTTDERTVASFSSSGDIREPEEDPVDEPEPAPQPEPEEELVVDESVEPGETVEARVSVEGRDEEELDYRWRVSSAITEDEVREMNQPEISFETRPRVRDENPEIRLVVRTDDGYAQSLTQTFEWDIPDVEAEGLEVEYGTDSVTASISEEELNNRPQFRAGIALDGWNEISLHGRNMVGGIELELEQQSNSDFEDENDLIPYSVVEVSGDNIQGLGLNVESDISMDWLHENDLLVSSREAHVSYYELNNGGEWERLPVRISSSNLDDHVSLRPDRSATEERPYRLEGETTIAVAGDPSGIDFGNFAVNPQGDCEQLDENEPIPPGWEEIDVTCGTHHQVERVEDQLDRMTSRLNDQERYSSEIANAESYIDENRPESARIELERIEALQEAHDLTRRVDDFENQLERFEQDTGSSAEEYRTEVNELRSDIEAVEEGEKSREELRNLDQDLRDLQQDFHQEADQEQQQLREERREARQRGEQVLTPRTLNREAEQIENLPERTINQLPEELEALEELYEEPENLENRFDQVDQLIEDDELEEAQEELEQIEEEMNEAGLQELQEASSTYNTIERLRDHEDAEEEHLEDLNNAEELLVEEQNVQEASELVDDVQRSVEVQQVREMVFELLEDDEVRELIRDVISEVIPGL